MFHSPIFRFNPTGDEYGQLQGYADVRALHRARDQMDFLGFRHTLPDKEMLDLKGSSRHLLVLGNAQYAHEYFPIVLGRPTQRAIAQNESIISGFMNALVQALDYYDIRMIFDTSQTPGALARELVQLKIKEPMKQIFEVEFVLVHVFPSDCFHGHFIPFQHFNAIKYVMDYSPLFNSREELVPQTLRSKMIPFPYVNMPEEKFNRSIAPNRNISKKIRTIIEGENYILTCGSNRRDYGGAIAAANQLKINMIIAASDANKLSFNNSRYVSALATNFDDFNVLLRYALFVVVPAALPQSTPVGIGTIAKVKMAGKITVATNNTGVDNMILHGFDGFFVNDPSAEYEKHHREYEQIFRKLLDLKYRSDLEKNVFAKQNMVESAASELVKVAHCTLDSVISNSSPWTLHLITDCAQCQHIGRALCQEFTVESPHVAVSDEYATVGPTLSEIGCEVFQKSPMKQIVRNSKTKRVYAAIGCLKT